MAENIKYIRRTIGLEPYISRIPGLFPFISTRKNCMGELVNATEAKDGCYGKLMPSFYDTSFTDVWGDISEENGVPYRDMMNMYYAMIDGKVKKMDNFVAFVEEYIGLIEVAADIDWEKCDLAPTTVFLAQIQSLYIEYKRMFLTCDFYKQLLERGEKPDPITCCIYEQFERMGGEKMFDWLGEHLDDAKDRANKVYEYAIKNKKIPTFNIDIPLTSHCEDMGVVVPLISQWKPKEKYFYNTWVIYNNQLHRAKKSSADSDGWVNGSIWNKDVEKLEFNHDAFDCCNEIETMIDSDDKDKFNEFIGRYVNEYVRDKKNNTISTYHSNSQLWSCRREVSYLNEIDEQEVPEEGEDWLFYYRINQPVKIEYETDYLGNLITTDNEKPNQNNLNIIGNVITNIEANQGDKTITFKYVIGVKLFPDNILEETDDDGNKLYKLPADVTFTVDDNDTNGVKYEEVYQYSDSRLSELIESGNFNKYVNSDHTSGDFDRLAKYPFKRYSSAYSYEQTIGDIVVEKKDVKSVVTDQENTIRPMSEIEEIPFIRNGYHLGISYPDEIDASVFIRRGTTSVFERHYKLSEVKTLTDMENYANGGFFNVIDGKSDSDDNE